MQTIFHISDARTLYSHWKDELKTNDIEWSQEAAAHVIAAWQTKYSSQVEAVMNPSSYTTSKSPVIIYYEESLHRILEEFSEFSLIRIVVGYSFVVRRYSPIVSS